MKTATAHAPAASPPRPLSFDDRLALAALAVDARTDTAPFDLADVIRVPADSPQPAAPSPYSSPIADLLHRARIRLETAGWCRTALHDESGAVCPIRAIRLEARGRRDLADDACIALLAAIQRDFPTAETIPSWNAQQSSPAPVLLALDNAARHAATHNQ
ncbi:hypothetical protein [Streptomyces sp. NPDC006610]|uniref:DUF6197 family protein n=1 Tax=Streptomyces sp. NPDC006610 TaxID=3154584 RepID=UPI00339F816C